MNPSQLGTYQKLKEIKIKGIKGEPSPYQKVAIGFFINNNGKGILADQMGLGKTLMSLAYIVHQKLSKTLVICPASVKFAWESEVNKWTKLKPLVINSRSKLTASDFNEHDIFIINYDILSKFYDFLVTIRFDCIVIDEFTYIKNSSSKRSKLTRKIAKQIQSILLLSGTPMLNRPKELFNGLQLMDPVTWNNEWKFQKRYCNGHQGFWGWDANGVSHIDELREKISKYFLRRTKAEVLPDLPPKIFVDIPTELDNKSQFEYDLAMSSLMEYLQKIKGSTDPEIRRSMQAEKLVRLGELRKITTNSKIGIAEEIINNVIEGGEKIVVFCAYNEPLEKLSEKFDDIAVIITGKTPELIRKKSIEAFQDNNKVKVFLGGIKSCGMGISLTAASTMLFIDQDFTPANMLQASDRCHRPPQKKSVTIYQLLAKNTIDERMREILREKQEIFDKLFEKEEKIKKSSDNILNDIIKGIKI